MSKQQNKAAGSDTGDNPSFELQRIYVRDVSFHAPKGVEAFRSKQEEEIKLELNIETRKLPDDLYEVTLLISVAAVWKKSQTLIYQVEVKQAGLFAIRNIPEKDFMRTINTSCPGILFPYARQTISGLIERGGFPPMLLAPMNFEALHQQYLLQLQQTKEAPAEPKH